MSGALESMAKVPHARSIPSVLSVTLTRLWSCLLCPRWCVALGYQRRQVAWGRPLNVPFLQELQESPPDHCAGTAVLQDVCAGVCRGVCWVCLAVCAFLLLDVDVRHAAQHSLYNLIVPAACDIPEAQAESGSSGVEVQGYVLFQQHIM